MPQLPQSLLRTEVTGPAGGPRAEGEDFGGGRSTLIGARRSASNASRGAADSARSRAGSIDRVADAELRAGLAEASGIASVARGAAELGDALYERRKQADISDLTAKVADGQAQWATQLDETLRTADPGDTEVVPRFLKGFDEYRQGLAKSAKTRAGKEYVRQTTARLRGHFFETAMRGQSELASVKTVQDFIAHQSKSGNALMVDPEGLGLAFERLDMFLATAKTLDPKKRLELETAGRADLARAAVRGIISRDFGEARERLKAGEFSQYLDADSTKRLMTEADAEERDQRIEAERQKAEARAALEEAQKATGSEFVNLLSEGKLSPKAVRSSNLDWREKEHFLNAIERKAKGDGDGPPKTNYTLARRLVDKVEAGELKDEKELYKYLYRQDGGGLDQPTFNHIAGLIRSETKPEDRAAREAVKTLKQTARRAILGSNFLDPKDPVAEAAYYRYGALVDETVQEYRDQGKDWRVLFDVDSKDFIGRRIGEFIAARDQQKAAFQRKLQGQVQVFGPAPGAERKPGESAADYLKRTGGAK